MLQKVNNIKNKKEGCKFSIVHL